MKTTTKRWVIAVAGKTPASFRPHLPYNWSVQRIGLDNLMRRSQLTPITVVEAKYATGKSGFAPVARALAYQQRASGPANLIVICDEAYGAINDRIQLLDQFPQPAMVSITHSMAETRQRIEELVATYQVLQEREKAPHPGQSHPSPIDNVREIVEASNDLRESSGNLSAKKVATLFGFTLRNFAQLLGRLPQTLSKTPDADSLQNELGYFEKIARLRAVLPNDASFRKWVRMSNPALGGDAPLKLLQAKEWQELADLVDDILTGSPT